TSPFQVGMGTKMSCGFARHSKLEWLLERPSRPGRERPEARLLQRSTPRIQIPPSTARGVAGADHARGPPRDVGRAAVQLCLERRKVAPVTPSACDGTDRDVFPSRVRPQRAAREDGAGEGPCALPPLRGRAHGGWASKYAMPRAMKVALLYPPTCDPTAPYLAVPT